MNAAFGGFYGATVRPCSCFGMLHRVAAASGSCGLCKKCLLRPGFRGKHLFLANDRLLYATGRRKTAPARLVFGSRGTVLHPISVAGTSVHSMATIIVDADRLGACVALPHGRYFGEQSERAVGSFLPSSDAVRGRLAEGRSSLWRARVKLTSLLTRHALALMAALLLFTGLCYQLDSLTGWVPAALWVVLGTILAVYLGGAGGSWAYPRALHNSARLGRAHLVFSVSLALAGLCFRSLLSRAAPFANGSGHRGDPYFCPGDVIVAVY